VPLHPHIAIVNDASSPLADAQAQRIAKALATQVSKDFYNTWGLSAYVSFVPKGRKPPKGYWWLAFLNTSDEAGALGYHDLTPEGLPLGKAFVGTDLQYGAEPSVTASHELLEMLGDPYINLTTLVQDSQGVRVYAYENCDAVEADELGYTIDLWDGKPPVLVSDFVLPRYFDPTASGPLSFKGNVHEPFEIAPGGYLSYWSATGGWQQAYGSKPQPGDRARVGSRRERRSVKRDEWLLSTVETTVDDAVDAVVEAVKPLIDDQS
jgi:hypothetical protein